MILKHADFEVAAWGEFASGPNGSGDVTLSQSVVASYPDRPGGGAGVGLLVSIAGAGGGGGGSHWVTNHWATNHWAANHWLVGGAAGDQAGQYIAHDLGSEQTLLHTRMLFAPGTLGGGAVVICAGYDSGATETWRITYTPSTGDLTATLATSETLSAALVSLTWHAIELQIDATNGVAELWVDGQSAATASGTFTALATQSVRVGGVIRDVTATGNLYLDEWVMATAYVGPVAVTPTAEDASDPARWLVVYNTALADSVTWAQWYLGQRRIPYANLCGLNLSTSEDIANAAWLNMRDAIASYITRHADLEITGILLGHGCPGMVTGTPNRSVVSLLMDLTDDTVDQINPFYESGVIDLDDLPTRASLVGGAVYLVAEIQAPTLAEARDLTTLADALGDENAAGAWISNLTPSADMLASSAASWGELTAWLAAVQSHQVRLPRVEGYDGSAHGHAIEFCDAAGGTFDVDGQRRALLASVGAITADYVRE